VLCAQSRVHLNKMLPLKLIYITTLIEGIFEGNPLLMLKEERVNTGINYYPL